MFRSETMSLNKVMFAQESMWETMNFLARTQKVMMHLPSIDPSLNKQKSSLSLYGQKTAKRCEDLLMEVETVKENMTKFNWPLTQIKNQMITYIQKIDEHCKKNDLKGKDFFESENKKMGKIFAKLKDQLDNYKRIIQSRIDLIERAESLEIMDELVPTSFLREEEGQGKNKKFNQMLGLVPTKNLIKLKKILFRVSRENIIMKYKNLPLQEDPLLKKEKIVDKALVYILMPKTEREIMVNQVMAMLDHYEFIKIHLPHSKEKNEMKIKQSVDLQQNKSVLIKTKKEINEIFKQLAQPHIIANLSYIYFYQYMVKREQAFSQNLMFIEEKDGFNQLLFWIPEKYQLELEKDISYLNKKDKDFIPPKIQQIENNGLKPPTYFETNQFTSTYQKIVDTYGIPRYKECNPGLYTIISFPFLFGVMFGDIGHGLMLFIFGLYLVFFLNNKLSPLNDVKYLILMCGFFSFYCGFIYNEFFALPFAVQSSCYKLVEEEFVREKGCVYAFGLDWVWGQSTNETSFINSFKMKFSIIIGVSQMLFGIILKGLNGYQFSSYVDIFFEAIPQFVFLTITFGYMSLLIIVKWLTDFTNIENPVSIIQTFINFFTVSQPLIGDQQETLQICFTIICVLCIFLMLFPKPLILHSRNRKKEQQRNLQEEFSEQLILTGKQEHNEHEEEGLGELMVHQMIETIEFVLGSISNTASYLRLWALSLAHGQLAKVFLELIFGWTIKESNNFIVSFIVIVLGFTVFIMITFAVIMIMDFMECMLHGLRLHWVEFQNKFFKGDGKPFVPFTYEINNQINNEKI